MKAKLVLFALYLNENIFKKEMILLLEFISNPISFIITFPVQDTGYNFSLGFIKQGIISERVDLQFDRELPYLNGTFLNHKITVHIAPEEVK